MQPSQRALRLFSDIRRSFVSRQLQSLNGLMELKSDRFRRPGRCRLRSLPASKTRVFSDATLSTVAADTVQDRGRSLVSTLWSE